MTYKDIMPEINTMCEKNPKCYVDKTQGRDKEGTAAVIPTAAGSIALVAESRIQYAKESRAG
nr:hypothetical protein [uncultured Oscillibacter sp.]